LSSWHIDDCAANRLFILRIPSTVKSEKMLTVEVCLVLSLPILDDPIPFDPAEICLFTNDVLGLFFGAIISE
jgi:hypothetical protein